MKIYFKKTSKLDSNNRIVIPKEATEILDITSNDKLTITVIDSGKEVYLKIGKQK